MNTMDSSAPITSAMEIHTQGESQHMIPFGGLTIRDWFAGMALGHIPTLLDVNGENLSVSNIADHAFQIADAMLSARKQGGEA